MPPQLRQEALRGEVTERRRRASFDETISAQELSLVSPPALDPATAYATDPWSTSIREGMRPGQSGVESAYRAIQEADEVVESVRRSIESADRTAQSISTMNLSFDSIFQSSGMPSILPMESPELPLAINNLSAPTDPPPTAVAPLGVLAPVEISENARFLASLAFDLRMDVLLSADAAFLESLPATAQAEARAMRNAHSGHAGRISAMTGLIGREGADVYGGLPLRELSVSRYGRYPSELFQFGAQTPNFATSSSVSRRHERERSALAMLHTAQLPAATDSEAAEAQKSISTSYFLTDDRIVPAKDLPFGVSLVACLFGYMLGVTKVRGPRPLLRLLATTCRYRGTRPWVLRSLMAVLTRDPAQFVHSMGHVLGHGDMDLSESAKGEILALSKRITVPSSSSSGSMSNSVEMRRFLSLLSYIMKKTDKLVWFDMLTIKYYGRSNTVSESSSPHQVNDMKELSEEKKEDDQKEIHLKSKGKNSKPEEHWLFGSLLGLLNDPAVLTSSPTLDTTLHVIELMCDPLGHLTAKEANSLAADQIKKFVPQPVILSCIQLYRSISYEYYLCCVSSDVILSWLSYQPKSILTTLSSILFHPVFRWRRKLLLSARRAYHFVRTGTVWKV